MAFTNDSLVKAVLADYRTAPIDERLRAMLGFLEKMTLTPEALVPEDLDPVRALGVSDRAIEDAIHVCAMFNVYDRLADAFEFEIPDERGFAVSATMLLKRGYV